MYNLADNPTPDINLTVKIKNTSMEQASMAFIKVYNPDRSRVLYETQQNIALAPDQEMEIPLQLILPTMTSLEMGICHTDYELYNLDGVPVQLLTESIAGRFAIYKVSKSFTPSTGYSVWITTKKDFFYWNEPAEIELHIKNYTEEPITLDWYYDWTHIGHHVLPGITVPANSAIDYPVKLDLPVKTGNSSSVLEILWVWHRIAANSSYKSSIKGINVKYPLTSNTKIAVNPTWIKIGDPIQYNINTKNALDIPLEHVEIKVFLEKRQWPDYLYNTLATVYNSIQTLGPGQTFSYSGTYTHIHNPAEELPAGMYRLRTEITCPNGSKESAAADFSFTRSYINVDIEPLMEPIGINSYRVRKYLEVDRSYPFKASIKNRLYSWLGVAVDVVDAKCVLSVKAETGQDRRISPFNRR